MKHFIRLSDDVFVNVNSIAKIEFLNQETTTLQQESIIFAVKQVIQKMMKMNLLYFMKIFWRRL